MTKYTMFMEDKENTNRTPRKMAMSLLIKINQWLI